MDILALLRTARDKAASDVHLVASSPPLLRIDGSLQAVDGAAPLAWSFLEPWSIIIRRGNF
jgi:Tfp pilus assembly pilus retraction ATPase PilT